MLDIKFIRENPELVQKGTNAKNFPVDITELLSLDASIKPLQQRLDDLRAFRNTTSKTIAKADPEQIKDLKQKILHTKEEMEIIQRDLKDKKEQFQKIMHIVAQPPRSDVPEGKSDKDNKVIAHWKEPQEFTFKAKDHLELGLKHELLDIERGVKLSGSRSYVLKNKGALLEQAIMRFVYDSLLERNFQPMSVPILVNDNCMEGTGYFPVGKDQAYYIEKDKLALIGTSEVPLCSFHSNDILTEAQLPLRFMAQTPCFRRESGTYGKDTRGLYRVHQFTKIEMVIIAPNDKEQTDKLHDELLSHAEYVMQSLELPYRKVYVCTGDLGQGQVRKHDLETWMPSRKDYGETHSCSSFYDFQSRRLNIKYKNKAGQKKYVYTLNNTACASPRILIPLLENHQCSDGSIKIPQCLRKYMQNLEYIK